MLRPADVSEFLLVRDRRALTGQLSRSAAGSCGFGAKRVELEP
jgi:hypothetical protein